MSRFKKAVMYVVLAAVSLVMLAAIGGLERSIERDIKTHHLRFTGEIKNAPGWVSFTTVALGSFRGLLADFLWLHQMSLKDQGSYFEMVQLASWITDLQPQFAGSAVYLGWEMAYNLSVTCSNYEDRWRWIQEGTRLLRDKAMVYNPEDVTIYFDMARIFTQKFGNTLDDAHLFYKNKLYMETTRIMGEHPNWEALAAVVPNFRLADWNQNLAFDARFPADSAARKLMAEEGYSDFNSLLNAYIRLGRVPEALNSLPTEDLDWLDNYLRAAWIWDAFKLNPHRVLAVNKEFGNLDWHTPEAQAIYWAYLGLEFKPLNQTRRQLDNIIAISLQESFRSGRPLITDPENMEYFIGVPNFSVVDRAIRMADEAYELNNKDESFLLSRNYFLRDALVLFYSYGQTEKAQEMLDLLRKYDPGMAENRQTLRQVYDALMGEQVRFATVKDIGRLIVGSIYCSLHYWVLGDSRRALELENAAANLYDQFVEENKVREHGVELPPFDVIYRTVVENFIKNAPEEMSKRLQRLIEQAQAQARTQEEEARKLLAPQSAF